MEFRSNKIPNYVLAQNDDDFDGKYYFGDCFLPGLSFPERYENRLGNIIIGGDLGDVHATDAYNDTELGGVALKGTTLMTGIEGLTRDEVESFIHKIVYFSYESIGGDTFIPNKKTWRTIRDGE